MTSYLHTNEVKISMRLSRERVMPIIKAALKEDIGSGDITTSALIDPHASSDAVILAKEECVICGVTIAEWIASQIDYSVRFKPNCKDGDFVGEGKEVAFVEGHSGSILRAERTMLNFLAFLSGVATLTRQFVEKVKPYGVKIMDTRKTLPLLRYLEKYAVFTGGGTNHRMGLYDQVLIKDNHIGIRRRAGRVKIGEIVQACRLKAPRGVTLEVEVTSVAEFKSALAGKPDIIMLDNMSCRDIAACVEVRRLSGFKPLLEASGRITLETVEDYAKSGVDMVSAGCLTSSVRPADLSLEIVRISS